MTAPDGVDPVDAHLGRALTLIHRILPRLDEPGRADAVQTALRQVVAAVTAAALEHDRLVAARRPAPIEGEVVALIAAAVAVVLGQPHRLVEVHRAAPTVAWVNAWAIEGRFQHYSSHKVR